MNIYRNAAAALLISVLATQSCARNADVSAPSLWFSQGRPTAQGLALASELRHAAERGLRPTDYALEPDIENSCGLNRDAAPVEIDTTGCDISLADTQLSLAAGRLVSDLHSGRVLDARREDLEVPRPAFDVVATLHSLAQSPSVATALDALEPQFLHYRLLKAALAKYRLLAQHPELTRLPEPGKQPIRPGESYSGTSALVQLLTATGDLPVATRANDVDEQKLGPELVAALKTFQARHGMRADGTLGRDTYIALTTPFTQRVQQIELSLERWRRLPPRLEGPAIVVNIPEYRLFALYSTADLEQRMLKMDVIVGKTHPFTQTPVFAAEMRYVVLHPYWDVPASIVRRELLALIRKDPDYLARNDYEIVRGQTDAAEVQPVTSATITALAAGTLRLRQKPGPKNPLGFVKFMLPNQYDVYLHGTSAPALFAGAQRAFSHGCVRVADPTALLEYVLRGNPDWDAERLAAQLSQPGPHRIQLREPIRVYIVYATALASEDGRTLFFRDIYGHDTRLAAALEREEPWGVWGGEILDRGTVIERKRPRGRPRKDTEGNPAAA